MSNIIKSQFRKSALSTITSTKWRDKEGFNFCLVLSFSCGFKQREYFVTEEEVLSRHDEIINSNKEYITLNIIS